MENEQLECGRTVEKLQETHPWIASTKQLFNKPGTDFDFSTRDYDSARQELDTLQTEQKKYVKRPPFLATINIKSIQLGC